MSADVRDVIAVAERVCQRRGYPVSADTDYASAVNYAVARALHRWRKRRKRRRSLKSLAVLYALRECEMIRRKARRFEPLPDIGRSPVERRLADTDIQILTFVAVHGRQQAARLLEMSLASLQGVLDGIALRAAQA